MLRSPESSVCTALTPLVRRPARMPAAAAPSRNAPGLRRANMRTSSRRSAGSRFCSQDENSSTLPDACSSRSRAGPGAPVLVPLARPRSSSAMEDRPWAAFCCWPIACSRTCVLPWCRRSCAWRLVTSATSLAWSAAVEATWLPASLAVWPTLAASFLVTSLVEDGESMLCVVPPLVVVAPLVVGGGSGALTECVIGSPRIGGGNLGPCSWSTRSFRAPARPCGLELSGMVRSVVSSTSRWLRARRGQPTRTPACDVLKRKIAFRDDHRRVSTEVVGPEGVAPGRLTRLVAGAEPLPPLLRGAVAEGVLVDRSVAQVALDEVVADAPRCVERTGDVVVVDLGDERIAGLVGHRLGMVGPGAGIAVGLQLQPHRPARRSGLPGRDLLVRAEQVLHVVGVLVGDHVGVDEQAALGAEAGLQVVEEAQVDVDQLVGGAVERPGAARRAAALRLHLAGEVHGVGGPVVRAEHAAPVVLDRVDVGDHRAVHRVVGVPAVVAGLLELAVVRLLTLAQAAQPAERRADVASATATEHLDQHHDQQPHEAEPAASDGQPPAAAHPAAAPSPVLHARRVQPAALAVPHRRKTSRSGADIRKRTSTEPCTRSCCGVSSSLGAPASKAAATPVTSPVNPARPARDIPASATSTSPTSSAPKAPAYSRARRTASSIAARRASSGARLSGRSRHQGPSTMTSSSSPSAVSRPPAASGRLRTRRVCTLATGVPGPWSYRSRWTDAAAVSAVSTASPAAATTRATSSDRAA